MLHIITYYIHHALLASAYGSGTFNNSCNYNGTGCNAGILPDTGGVLWTVAFSVMIIAGLSLLYWLRAKRKHRLAQDKTPS